jgi:hypothetical protein
VSRRTPPAGATRPAALACRPRQRLARGRASRPQAARPSNRDFAATQGRRPGSPAGSAPDPRWACRRAITGPSNWPRAHSRKRECRSRLLRRAPGADGLPECEPPPTVRSAPITVAMPGRIFWKLRRWGPNRYSASRPSMSIGLCANWGGRPQVIYKLPYGSVRSKRRSVLSRFRFGRSLTR